MDNFRKIKRSNNTGAVDGMIYSRMRRRLRTGSSHLARSGVSTANISSYETRIGDFRRQEGFIPRKTKPLIPDGRGLGRNPYKHKMLPIDMTINNAKNKNRKPKPPKNWKKLMMRTIAGFMVLILLIGGYLTFKGFIRARQIFRGGGQALTWDCDLDPSKLRAEGDGRINILLLGKGGPEQTDGPDLTDTIIVASIDPCNKDAGLLSVPRDLAVKMELGGNSKINAVYALTKMSAKNYGKSDEIAEKTGIDAIEKTVENVTGMPIHYYVMIDFTAFEKAIDAVGGIEIDVKKPVFENMSLKGKAYRLDVQIGNQHFDGLRALAYTRSRYTSERGDFDRSERQREVIIALRNKALSVGTYSNPVKLSQLIDSFGSRVTTDLNLSSDASKLYNLAQEIDSSKIQSLSLVDEPNVLITGSTDASLGSVQIPKAGMYKYDEIRSFVRNKLIDGFIRRENPNIAVLNGTTISGLGTRKANELKGYGYNVATVGDMPNKNTTTTQVIDLRDNQKKYTKRYLELRYKTTAIKQLPPGVTLPDDTDFVIILGQNEKAS